MIKPEFIVERQGRSFVLYAGLLSLAHEQGLKAIRTQLIQIPADDNGLTAIVRAEVETERGTFSGIGDANPANVTRVMLTVTIRLAETRAKARALRDAVNVAVVALEELGDADDLGARLQDTAKSAQAISVAVVDDAPATDDQRRAINRLAHAAEVVVNLDGLSRSQAGEMIRRLQVARPA
jgi:hypothetical protein